MVILKTIWNDMKSEDFIKIEFDKEETVILRKILVSVREFLNPEPKERRVINDFIESTGGPEV